MRLGSLTVHTTTRRPTASASATGPGTTIGSDLRRYALVRIAVSVNCDVSGNAVLACSPQPAGDSAESTNGRSVGPRDPPFGRVHAVAERTVDRGGIASAVPRGFV